MSSKSEQILAAAFEAFSRYGLQKTTMGDIAKSAGVSRQTLYNIYENKETVLAAVVRNVADETRIHIVDLWQKGQTAFPK